jgi:hypothetical protein
LQFLSGKLFCDCSGIDLHKIILQADRALQAAGILRQSDINEIDF